MNMEKAANKNHTPFYSLRYERKFIFQHISLEDLINTVIFTNSFFFKEIYTKRTVNNIYFDDNNYSFYKKNVNGDGIREKYRIRWYNDQFSKIKNPTIEIKKKFGEVGDKFSHKLNNFETNIEFMNRDQVHSLFIKTLKETNHNQLINNFHILHPSLYNSYERKYFLSACEKFRITLDFNMNFFDPNSYSIRKTENLNKDIILELKYDNEHDTESRILTQQIGTRLSKNSKYVRGINTLKFLIS
ncbi:polyphosphate polymerase domain-containing protein [uncultured Aquimarina sp.]|uniref:polyphosphate polymerase domain-containing protein n=1 Tax=uncultured Aquimarina sp. TaxID=575652 RepID=UPI002621A21A|nr:polyphosphate polymerase domain-containing protein [uncultured Aquimarina sp.]